MSGDPIKLAVQALKLLLHSIPLGSKFNIVSFGSRHSLMFPQSVDYNEKNLLMAVTQLQTFQADYGGTEIL